jgi:tetratricopeptide (TPR) repeat protein
MREKLYPRGRFPNGHPEIAAGLNNLCGILASLGQLNKALSYSERALAAYETLYPKARFPDGEPEFASCLNNLGVILERLGQKSKAIPYYERSLAMKERLYPPARFPQGHPDLAASLSNLGSVFVSSGQARTGLSFFERALAMRETLYPPARFPDGHPHLALSLHNVGAAFKCLEERGKALVWFNRSVEMKKILYPPARFPEGHLQLAMSLHAMGATLTALNEPAQALPCYERAFEMYRARLRRDAVLASEAEALDLERSLPAAKDEFLSLALELPDESPERFYAQFFDSKAFLTRILQRRHEATRAAITRAEDVKERWQALQAVRRELGGLLVASPAKVRDRDERVRDLTDKKEMLERELAKALPELERSRRLAKLGPKDLVEILPRDVVLLDFVRYVFVNKDKPQRHYAVFLLAPAQQVRMIALGPAAPIDAAIHAWRQDVEQRRASAVAEALAKLIWSKIAPHLRKETTTLLIAPDGDLTRLPFAALPVGRLSAQPHTGVLLEDYRISYVPHAPFALEQLLYLPSFAKTSNALLAVGDVHYDLAGHKDQVAPWPVLPATAPEIGQLATLSGGREVRALRGGGATVADSLAFLPQAGYAHFATHGFFDDRPPRSARACAICCSSGSFAPREQNDTVWACATLSASPGWSWPAPTRGRAPARKAASSPAKRLSSCRSKACVWRCCRRARRGSANSRKGKAFRVCSVPFTWPAVRTSSPVCGR